eukprot:4425919-Alexandrium_andersonii.AAC.1
MWMRPRYQQGHGVHMSSPWELRDVGGPEVSVLAAGCAALRAVPPMPRSATGQGAPGPHSGIVNVYLGWTSGQ